MKNIKEFVSVVLSGGLGYIFIAMHIYDSPISAIIGAVIGIAISINYWLGLRKEEESKEK